LIINTTANIVENIGCGIYDQDIYLLPSILFAKVIKLILYLFLFGIISVTKTIIN